MAPPVFSPRHEQIPLGILYMVGSTLVFAAVNALVKWEVALYPSARWPSSARCFR
jgi:hypothetical protein